MPFRVPADHAGLLREFIALPDEKIDRFLEALDKAPPQYNFHDLALQVFSDEIMAFELTEGILLVLVSLYRTADLERPTEGFLDADVFPSLMKANVFSAEKSNEEWAKLRKFFLSALSRERTLGTAAKAGPVQTDHDRIFCGARILTDLRPIYHREISEKPSAATVVHMLKITHRDHYGKRYDSYFALDSNDLALIKNVVERAEKKEETLRNVMKDSGITVLGAGLFY
jgi:transcriptional regulator of aromatic amino acid metabolism